ncbi:acyltransferase family protein [Mycolicibacterium mucogenicum]|uniref:acyltransferase family protein n=1 Tax=Mycolicibacterium mucogenicum TaxID=56689 RepID=UPI0009EBA9AB|nr:acyltransferase family protein [Mycolicibacterium mucogenicum]KAB7751640.1 acyltransferase [Mycolicibacterium mucogenicum DSM 44124]
MAIQERRRHTSGTRKRRAKASGTPKRLDIQGLRATAILAVLVYHLFNVPSGGFVGVDVFFVISGFLITGILVRDAQARGNVSFKRFYWNRLRRIVPAATVVLLLTYLASVLVFLPFRSNRIGIDALFAFVFMSNWWFAYEGTDYFQAAVQTVSPLQHYWTLSVEEQFYFVWPALIFAISLIVIRKSWTHSRRMALGTCVMATVIVASFGWALYESAHDPAWAYFNTFSRVWELGLGAVLATTAGTSARIPHSVRPFLSWSGLVVIGLGLLFISTNTVGFPAPWAALPVLGSAMVIAAGIGEEPKYQWLLRNPLSAYIGDISYSLYLVHWPVIVILSALMTRGPAYYLTSITCIFGLAIASYHFVENPLRRADWRTVWSAPRDLVQGHIRVKRSSQYAALGAIALLTIGLCTYAVRPDAYAHTTPPKAAAYVSSGNVSAPEPKFGPAGSALQNEINHALQATAWPMLEPSIPEVMSGEMALPEIGHCGGGADAPASQCAWGSPSAPVRIVLVGDSIGLGYAGALRDIALGSNDLIQFHNFAMGSCAFVDDEIDRPGLSDNCEGRKRAAIDFINTNNPNVVIVANQPNNLHIAGSHELLGPSQWADSLHRIVQRFRPKAQRLVFMSPPPAGPSATECYGKRSSTPADCVGKVDNGWSQMANAEQQLAAAVDAIWIDSRPWFCSVEQQLCPAFVGTSPTKYGAVHMAPTYADKLYPVMIETLQQKGIL